MQQYLVNIIYIQRNEKRIEETTAMWSVCAQCENDEICNEYVSSFVHCKL